MARLGPLVTGVVASFFLSWINVLLPSNVEAQVLHTGTFSIPESNSSQIIYFTHDAGTQRILLTLCVPPNFPRAAVITGSTGLRLVEADAGECTTANFTMDFAAETALRVFGSVTRGSYSISVEHVGGVKK